VTPDYIVKGSATYRVIQDERGSVREVVNTATGNVAEAIDYDEFGRVLSDSSPGFQPFGFAGGIWDADTGLVHFGAREYDPETGRFTSKDPLGFSGGDTNLYGYTAADPINFVDPDGASFLGLGPDSLSPISWVSDAVYGGLNFLSGGSLDDIACNGLNWKNGLMLGINFGTLFVPGLGEADTAEHALGAAEGAGWLGTKMAAATYADVGRHYARTALGRARELAQQLGSRVPARLTNELNELASSTSATAPNIRKRSSGLFDDLARCDGSPH
jgi:RHS repeat-associated protein